MGTEKRVELLSPAGSYDSFLGAIHAGADAVYLGGEKFGARAYAENFTEEQLCKAVRYAHLFNRKVYLTMNTLVKEKEMKEIEAYLRPLYEAGLDGVIVQDMGVFFYIKEHFQGLSLHVSTQMAITGSEGAAKLKALGAERIVPARELSLGEIRHIKEETGLEIETFIHGAMCYCYSGQCLFSSMLGGRSGNRGKCAQPCRLPYKVNQKEGYYLSLKDMCTLEKLPRFMEAGIDSFKIEGRMKKPEYVAGVTALYRKYIDRILAGADEVQVEQEDMDRLRSLYIRSEIQDGYYERYNGREMITLKKPSYSGSEEGLLREIRENYIEKQLQLPVRGSIFLKAGEPVRLQLESQNAEVCVQGEVVQEAQKQPLQEETVRKQIEKCGGTSFYMEKLQVEIVGSVFLPVKALNELRRNALEQLEENICKANGFSFEERKQKKDLAGEECNGTDSFRTASKGAEETAQNGIYVSVQTKEQLFAVKREMEKESAVRESVQAVFLAAELAGNITADAAFEELREELAGNVYIAFPYVMRQKDAKALEKFLVDRRFKGILLRNMEELSFLQRKNYTGKRITDAGLYMWNKEAQHFFEGEADLCTLPLELNRGEKTALENSRSMQVIYGRIPMMVSVNCIRKTAEGCRGDVARGSFTVLTDRYDKEFPVYTNCSYCYNVIYNSVPLSLHKEFAGKKKKYRLDFTVEQENETAEILRFFCKGYQGENVHLPYKDYTTGHEKRGVD